MLSADTSGTKSYHGQNNSDDVKELVAAFKKQGAELADLQQQMADTKKQMADMSQSMDICCPKTTTGIIPEITDDIQLLANPNPFRNSCTVTIKLPSKGKLTISNIQGLQISSYELASGITKLEINGEMLGMSGTYIIEVVCDNGKTAEQRITFVK